MEDAMANIKMANTFIGNRFFSSDPVEKNRWETRWLSDMERESVGINELLNEKIEVMDTAITEGAAANVEPLEKPTDDKVIRPVADRESGIASALKNGK